MHVYAHLVSHAFTLLLLCSGQSNGLHESLNVLHRVILEIYLITKNSSFLMCVIKEKVAVCKTVCVCVCLCVCVCVCVCVCMFQAYHIILCVYYSIHIIHITIFLTVDTENCTWIMCFWVFFDYGYGKLYMDYVLFGVLFFARYTFYLHCFGFATCICTLKL